MPEQTTPRAEQRGDAVALAYSGGVLILTAEVAAALSEELRFAAAMAAAYRGWRAP